MSDDPLIRCWTTQPTDAGGIALERLRREARSFERVVRRRNRRERVAGGVVIAVFASYAWLLTEPLMRTGSLMIIAATVFVMVQLGRRAHPDNADVAAFGLPLVDYQRRQLARQRDALQSAWLWYVAPLMPGLLVLTWGQAALVSPIVAMTIAATQVALAAAIVLVNRRVARRLQREIDRLEPDGAVPRT